MCFFVLNLIFYVLLVLNLMFYVLLCSESHIFMCLFFLNLIFLFAYLFLISCFYVLLFSESHIFMCFFVHNLIFYVLLCSESHFYVLLDLHSVFHSRSILFCFRPLSYQVFQRVTWHLRSYAWFVEDYASYLVSLNFVLFYSPYVLKPQIG